MLVLLQSIMSDERRSWGKLLVSCIIGGAAAVLAGNMFADSAWVYGYCGVAAIIAENIGFGLLNASKQFRDHPLNVFAQVWRIVMPSFGKTTDKPGLDLPEHIAATVSEPRG